MYPEKQVTGVDISQRMLEYAQLQALRNQLHNAHFREMDILKQPLEFSPHTFDLINMRLISSMFRTPNHWLRLLQECMRVTRPGGFIYLTDCECYISNSPIAEKFFALCTKAAYLAGNSFSADGRQLAITPMMGRLLRQAGYQNVQHKAFAIDGSAGAKNHQQFYEDIVVFLKFVQPILVRTGVVATPEEAETLYYQTLEEMRAKDFNCIWYFLTVCGEKAVTD
jgi:ubiquinone/menaquinone biosynthesis C-methylase UbiE